MKAQPGESANSSFTDQMLSNEADAVFPALADRTRRRILVRLASAPDDAGAIARDLELSRQAVAKHLRILERAGIVSFTTKSGRHVHSVAPSKIREISDLLGAIARGWDRRLDAVRTRAEDTKQLP